MRKRLRYFAWLFLLAPLLLLTGCDIDLVALTKNPVVMVIIGGAVLYFVFKHSGKH